MSANCLVSIIIPAYNTEKFVGDAIQSVLTQTYRPIEVIVVDDGSTDLTKSIAASYTPCGVSVVSQDHLGAAAARNCGLRQAQGEYIQYMDSDDLLHRRYIEQKMEVAIRNPESLIYGSIESFDVRPDKEFSDGGPPVIKKAGELVEEMYARRRYFIGGCSFLIPRSILVGSGPWREDLFTADDYEYVARLLIQAEQVCYVPGAVYYYRSVENSLRAVTNPTRAASALRAYELAVGQLSMRFPALFDDITIAQGLFDTLVHSYPSSRVYETEVLKRIAELVGRRRLRSDAIGGPRMQLLASLVGWRVARYVGLMLGELRRLRPL